MADLKIIAYNYLNFPWHSAEQRSVQLVNLNPHGSCVLVIGSLLITDY